MTSFLDRIEDATLDESVPVATALRMCVALGGRNGSEALREWAEKELTGYSSSDELPDYRTVRAPIQLDAMIGQGMISGQSVPPAFFPEEIRDEIREQVALRDGIAQIEALSRSPEIKLSLGGNLAALMNVHRAQPFEHIDRIYWAVSPSAMKGVVDQVRTALVRLVAELRSTTASGENVPSAAVTDQAMQFVISGDRPTISVTNATAKGEHASASVMTGAKAPAAGGFWTTGRIIWGAIVGLAAIGGTIFTAIQTF